MVGQSSAKTFILDTSVILHNPSCIHQFQDNDIVIPLVVIEEIDRFKRGSQVIILNAREFARTLDSLTGNSMFNGGVSLGPGKGVVWGVIAKGLNEEIREINSQTYHKRYWEDLSAEGMDYWELGIDLRLGE
jgi:PhoH-like ATPase